MFRVLRQDGPNCPAIQGTIINNSFFRIDNNDMRIFFLAACAVIGMLAGLWWSGFPNSASTTTNQTTASNPPDNNQSAQTAIATANVVPVQPQTPARVTPEPSVSESPSGSEFSYHDGIMRAAPAVVSVYASEPSAENNTALMSQGSGVIVDGDGIVLTNLHLIENFNSISIVLGDGRSFAATLIGSDSETDLAVVRINAAMLPSLRLNEAKPLRVGDIVLAIGNPFGVGQTVTQGIVSATRRRIANGTVWQNFIQIDAAINPGNSGGALINPQGQLVGVNTAVFRGESGAIGIGFSIPAELLAQVVPQIISNGSVSRGWLGLGADDINMYPAFEALTQHGAVITEVHEDGPAMQIGVQPMDIIVQLGEQPVYNATQFLLAVSALPPGATVKLVLLRSPDPFTLNETGNTKPLEEMIFKVRLGTRPVINPPALR
ncbi:MAG: S1C family serine protease [Granulosicoccus sp.]